MEGQFHLYPGECRVIEPGGNSLYLKSHNGFLDHFPGFLFLGKSPAMGYTAFTRPDTQTNGGISLSQPWFCWLSC